MVAGTKRGLLLFGVHTFSVYCVAALFTSLFVEYYVHTCLLAVKAEPGKDKGSAARIKVQLSKWRLALLVTAQLIYAAYVPLQSFHLLGVLSAQSLRRRLLWLPRAISDESQLVLLFGLSWWLVRFPLLPSALTFTFVYALVQARVERCRAFVSQAAREMAVQRPKEGEWISVVDRVATACAALVVFVAAFLYDGSSPRSASLRGFLWLTAVMGVALLVVFSALQYVRRRAHAEETATLTREEVDPQGTLRGASLGPSDLSYTGFNAFARQTCQRRSMKAFLATRALHCYAHTLLTTMLHLLLTLGCGLQLSAAVRAAVVAALMLVSAVLPPLAAVLGSAVGKKRSLSVCCGIAAAVGGASLLVSLLTRDTHTGAANRAGPDAKGAPVRVSVAGTVWCVVLLAAQRIVLDTARELLDLAQDDVVEEDAILFGRASSMTTWTRRLCTACAAPMHAVALTTSLLFLAVAGAFRAVSAAQLTEAAQTGDTTPTTAVSTTAAPAAGGEGAAWYVAANGSTVLVLLGLHTCAVSVAMLAVWSRFYNLEGKHLQFVLMAARKRKDEQSVALV